MGLRNKLNSCLWKGAISLWVNCLFSNICFEWQGYLFDLKGLAVWQKSGNLLRRQKSENLLQRKNIWKFTAKTKIWKFPSKTKNLEFIAKTKIPELCEAAVALTQLLILKVNSSSVQQYSILQLIIWDNPVSYNSSSGTIQYHHGRAPTNHNHHKLDSSQLNLLAWPSEQSCLPSQRWM